MNNSSYQKWSNYTKLLTPICSGVLLGLLGYFKNSDPLLLIYISFLTVIGIFTPIILAILDKLHNEILNGQKAIHDGLLENFEYHGLLGESKTRFTAQEVTEKWEKIIEKVKTDFVGINFSHISYWKNDIAIKMIDLLGLRVARNNISARRIFVIKNDQEGYEWHDILNKHFVNKIEVGIILEEDYFKIRDTFNKINITFKTITGFNVIDKQRPGIVLDWHYDNNRIAEYADLKTGKEIAMDYIKFFDAIWFDHKCNKNAQQVAQADADTHRFHQ